jgi:hypothetical protein
VCCIGVDEGTPVKADEKVGILVRHGPPPDAAAARPGVRLRCAVGEALPSSHRSRRPRSACPSRHSLLNRERVSGRDQHAGAETAPAPALARRER